MWIMELFRPSNEILKRISSDEKNILSMYAIYPFGGYAEMMEFPVLHFVGVHESIIRFYFDDLKGEIKRLNTQAISNVVTELVYNWATHSSEGINFFSGLFLGDLGICHGLKDESFFKKPGIKNKLENKIGFEEFNKTPRDKKSSCHYGYNFHIFPSTDFIEVDSKEGILYCVQLKKNLIAPKGENGSSYFYNLKKQKNNWIGEEVFKGFYLRLFVLIKKGLGVLIIR